MQLLISLYFGFFFVKFLCIAQQEYYDVLHQGQENIQNIKDETGQIVMVKEKREFDGGAKKGNIVIRVSVATFHVTLLPVLFPCFNIKI